MVKCIRRRIAGPDAPIFKNGPQVFAPISRPHQSAAGKSLEQLLDDLKNMGQVKRGTVERSLLEQLERGNLPRHEK